MPDGPTATALPRDVDTLIRLVDSPDTTVRLHAIGILGELGPAAQPAIPTLIRVSESSTYETRYALRALEALGPAARTAIGPLGAIAQDHTRDITIRSDAVTALGAIGDPSAIPALAAFLMEVSPQTMVSMDAAIAIQRITGEPFPRDDGQGQVLDANRQPFMTLAARDWWEQTGQYLSWPPPP